MPGISQATQSGSDSFQIRAEGGLGTGQDLLLQPRRITGRHGDNRRQRHTCGDFAPLLAGGAVPTLVAHAELPVALEQAGSPVVLPAVAVFRFAHYLALAESRV
jgi:hypothetical protein